MSLDHWIRRFSPIIWIGWLLVLVAAIGWYSGIRFKEVAHFGLLALRELALLIFLLAGALGYGALALRALGLRERDGGIYCLFAIASGLGIIAHLTLILGMVRLLYASAAWILVSIGVAFTLLELSRYRKRFFQIGVPSQFSVFHSGLVLLIGLNGLYPLLTGALSPPVWWDEVAYHLAVPKIYVQHRAIVYIPFIPYSNWPMEAEMLFTIGLLFHSEILSHLVEWSSFLFTCWCLYLFGKHFFSPTTGLLAAAVFSSTPMVITLAGTGLIEPTLSLYVSLATFSLMKWLESEQKRDLVLSAIFGGLVASVKLNGAVIAAILGTMALFVTIIRHRSIKVGALNFGLFGFLSLAVVSPWYIKTWTHTGNPFWPFLLEFLGGRNWDALGMEYLLGFIQKPNYPITLTNWFLGLWRQTFHPIGPSQIAIGPLYLVLLPISVIALFFSEPSFRHPLRRLSVVGLLYYTAWFLQTHQTRFLMPTIPLLALLIAAGTEWLVSREKFFPNLLKGGLVLYMAITSWVTNPNARGEVLTQWRFLSGRLTRDAFLSTYVPGYETFLYANQHLPQDAYVLLALYECRGYYLDRKYAWANPISQRVLKFEQFENAEDLANYLKEYGFTHILFRPVGLERFMYIRHGEKVTRLMYALLVQESRLIYATPELELYELVPRTPAEN